MDHERLLFEAAPWTEEVLTVAKSLNDGNFLRGRTGWKDRKVRNPESIYEHTCKVALAAWHLLGTEEAVAMGVSHDFPEIYLPDHTPGQVSEAFKRGQEWYAMEDLIHQLPQGAYWFEAWTCFERKQGHGKYIFELDKICPSVHAEDLKRAGNGERLDEFYPYSRKKVKTPELVGLLDSICLGDIPPHMSAYEPYYSGLSRIELE